MSILFFIVIMSFLFYNIVYINAYYKRVIIIYIGNSFNKYHVIPNTTISCIYLYSRYKCSFTNNKIKKFDGSLYNGNKKYPKTLNSSYNIIMTIEKLSQVMFMKEVGNGKNKYYKLAIDYRLFENRYHISHPYLANISDLIFLANRNFNSLQSFIKRNNNIVYIQKKHYIKRQYIVKDIMKYYHIDSYGEDLNNIKWPITVSRNNKIEIIKDYKFCLAIENSVQSWNPNKTYEADSINNDYVTEKLFDCFKAGSIPIYFGPKNINLFLPSNNSIINLSKFENIKELVNYLNVIKNNKSLLYNHIEWHYRHSHDWYVRFDKTFKFNYCKICNYIKKYS